MTLAWSGDWPIPKRVLLPGVRVRVKVIAPEDADKMKLCDGAWVYDHEKQRGVILIDGRLPLQVQRYTLLHELQHAVIDVLDIAIEKHSDHVRTKRMQATVETAERLAFDLAP